MNVSTILAFIKSYLVIVICILVIVAALIVLPMISSDMNAAVKKRASSRKASFASISNLEKTNFQFPGSPQGTPVVINDRLIKEYKSKTGEMKDDAEKVVEAAIEHNQQEHDVLMDIFPKPSSPGAEEVLPPQFHEKIMAAYKSLLESVNAGQPPLVDDLQARLQVKRRQFLQHHMFKDETDPLTEEEQEQVASQLSIERVESYKDKAGDIGVYLDLETLDPPIFDRTAPPTWTDLFAWQWRYWVVEEVLAVVRDLNGNRPEPVNPIKRIEWIQLRGLMAMEHTAGKAPAPGRGGGRGGSAGGGGSLGGPLGGGSLGGPLGGGSMGGRGGVPGGSGPGRGAVGKTNFKAAPTAGSTNYDVSLSGRISNALYDVVTVDLDLVVETASIPEVLEAFSRQNFMTILDLEMRPADAFEAIAEGYYYGGDNMAHLRLTIETIWLREWITPRLDDDVRAMLGIAADPPSNTGGQPQQPGAGYSGGRP